jgi:S1-C subfamily serine protease
MPPSTSTDRRLWLVAIVVSLLFGAGAGSLSSFVVVTPSLHRLERLIDQVSRQNPPVQATSTPLEIIPVEPRADDYLGLPPALGVGRASPTVSVFRLDARVATERLFAPERITTAVAITNDGWLVTTEAAFSAVPRLAELGVGWKGRIFTPTKGIRDRATGLLFLKIDTRDLPAAALVSRNDVEIGEPVWGERATNQYLPSMVTGLGFAATSSASLSSDQWNRRFLLDGGVLATSAPVWDARGQLIGLTLPAALGSSVIPADAIRSGLASVLSGGDIRRPTLGVRYLDLADSFSRQSMAVMTKGALLVGERNAPAIVAQGPAATALREGDIIERIDQDVLDGSWTLAERVLEYRPGTAVTIGGLRQGKPFETRVTFGAVVTSDVWK